MSKFTENEYEKVERLLELHFKYFAKAEEANQNVQKEKEELEEVTAEDEDNFLIQRLDAGLFTLQLINFIIAELCAEKDFPDVWNFLFFWI